VPTAQIRFLINGGKVDETNYSGDISGGAGNAICRGKVEQNR